MLSGQSVPSLRWGQADTQRQVLISDPGFGQRNQEQNLRECSPFYSALWGRGVVANPDPSLGVNKSHVFSLNLAQAQVPAALLCDFRAGTHQLPTDPLPWEKLSPLIYSSEFGVLSSHQRTKV